MYGLRRTSTPLGAPLDLAIVRTHIAQGDNFDDDYVRGLIQAAAAAAENATHRQLLTATWELTLDRFPCHGRRLLLPLGTVQSVTSIEYVDTAGDEQTWDPADYQLVTAKEPAEIVPAYGATWPPTRVQPAAATVTYSVGYGATHESVPELLRYGMMLVVGHMYKNREAVVTGTIATEIPLGAQHIFEQFNLGDGFTDYDVLR
jgi:uncharacterized phiE125 gp8 family phage protein